MRQTQHSITSTSTSTKCGLVWAICCIFIASGCEKAQSNKLQGYIEGEYVYVAAPFAGQLTTLCVDKGAQVKVGDALFSLDAAPEQAAHDEAERRLNEAKASLENLKKGRRPTELDSVRAQLKQAEAALELATKELERRADLAKTGAVAQQEIDRFRSDRDQAAQRVAQLKSDLKTAQLGARTDEISAAEANVRALEAALVRADWNLNQKRQSAPAEGVVFDTLFRQGEWIPAGRPVVALLPPANVKLRVFVPEGRVGTIKVGDELHVHIDGRPETLGARVSFISPQAEYTPPVIYSNESRAKLVFMVEGHFDEQTAATLHPGQPADVEM